MVSPVRVLFGVQDGDLHETKALHALHLGARPLIGGIEPLVIAHLDDAPALPGGAGDLLGFGEAEPERLLDEQVLACLESGERELAVWPRGEHQHGVNVGGRDEVAVIGRAPVDVIAPGDGLERLPIDVGEADDGEEIGPLGQGRQVHHLRDAAAPDHRNS